MAGGEVKIFGFYNNQKKTKKKERKGLFFKGIDPQLVT